MIKFVVRSSQVQSLFAYRRNFTLKILFLYGINTEEIKTGLDCMITVSVIAFAWNVEIIPKEKTGKHQFETVGSFLYDDLY